MAYIGTSDKIDLQVARLTLRLDAGDTGLHLVVPPTYAKFLQSQEGIDDPLSIKRDHLVLLIQNEALPVAGIWGDPLCCTEIWELWKDESGCYVFVAPRGTPPKRIVLNPTFTTGEVSGDFSSSGSTGLYPLQGLDNVLFVNWLGSFGDVILHASGVVVDGKGYAFIGPAGAGKSTLAAALSSKQAAMVLGEDHIILRYLEGRFWIYGGPWHLNPAMCSPNGIPVEKLFFLDRNAAQGVKPLTPMDGITRMLQTAFIPYYRPNLVSSILDRLVLLAGQVSFFSLSYQLGSDVWKLIREA